MNRCVIIVVTACIFLLAAASCLGENYRLRDKNNETCIILNADLEFSFPYKADGEEAVAKWKVGKAASIDGSCDARTAQLQLNFTEPPAQLVLKFANSSGSVNLTDVTLAAVVNNGSVFANSSESGRKERSGSPNLRLSADSEYYECSSTKLQLADGASVAAAGVQLQAFGVRQDALANSSSVCAADQTTTSAAPTTTTAAPTTVAPTPEPTAPLLNFSAGCLAMQIRATFLVSYRSKEDNKTRTRDVVLPSGTKSSGQCGNKSETLTLKFYDGWQADMQFVGAADAEYRLSRVSLKYKLDAKLFPDAADANKTFTSASNDTFFKVTANGYYACSAKLSFKLDDRVSVHTADLMAQAFRANGTAGFQGTRVQCEGDLPHDNIVPIVVGSALAALVLVVLVAYIIGRRRSAGSGYQSV